MNFLYHKKFHLIWLNLSLILSPQLLFSQALADQITVNSEKVNTNNIAENVTATKICQSQLTSQIDNIINRSEFAKSRWGIHLETAGQNIYSRDAEYYFTPGSTVKLLTTAAALTKFGPEQTIKTSIYTDNQGKFYLVGRGDPGLTEKELTDLANQLKQQGITEINQLIADNTYFTGPSINPNWEWEDIQAGYGAAINSLMLNQNALDLLLTPQNVNQPLQVTWVNPQQGAGWQIVNKTLTVAPNQSEFVHIGRSITQPIVYVSGNLQAGAPPEPAYVAVLEPEKNFLERFTAILLNAGIAVKNSQILSTNQSNITPVNYSNLSEIAVVNSQPLTELIKETNQRSNNVYAGVLLHWLGKTTSTNPNSNTVTDGLRAIANILSSLQVSPNHYVIKDGSGLSRHNMISPLALVETLRAMQKSPHAEIYKNSLPIAGMSGTLKNRLNNTAAQGIVWAKTGNLTGVSSLAGYIEHPNYQDPLIFSIMVNQSNLSGAKIRSAIDQIVILFSQLDQCNN
jgi:D-alanyl-D-alanine carboxypeptidase/D-alanyl-D-alanine-endopeptidase (penicillin-binding protein 4)